MTAAWQPARSYGPTGRLLAETAAARKASRVEDAWEGILRGRRRKLVEAAAAQEAPQVGKALKVMLRGRQWRVVLIHRLLGEESCTLRARRVVAKHTAAL